MLTLSEERKFHLIFT